MLPVSSSDCAFSPVFAYCLFLNMYLQYFEHCRFIAFVNTVLSGMISLSTKFLTEKEYFISGNSMKLRGQFVAQHRDRRRE